MADPLCSLWYFKLKYTLLLAYHSCVIQLRKLSVELHDLLFSNFDFSEVFVLKKLQLVRQRRRRFGVDLLFYLQLDVLLEFVKIDALTMHQHSFFGLRLILSIDLLLTLFDQRLEFFIQIDVSVASHLSQYFENCLFLAQSN